MNLYEYLEKELDGLQTFVMLAHENIYNYLIKNFQLSISKSNIYQFIKYDFKSYHDFYCKSTFLLGYSFYESFIDDIIKNCSGEDAPFRYNDKIKKIIELGLIYNDTEDKTLEGSLIRNCIMHNKGKVNKKLNSRFSKYIEGQDIVITQDEINDFGQHARDVCKLLYDSAVEKYNLTV